MKTKVISEYGHREALLGLSLSYNITLERAAEVAKKLAPKDGGHNKFLESITVYLDVTAPRYWWSQMDTYRVGITKQSESTMHTLMKRELTFNDFEYEYNKNIDSYPYLAYCISSTNIAIRHKEFDKAKQCLPESFLQRRIICTNYKTLRTIVKQRYKHRLKEWKSFCEEVVDQLQEKEYTKEWI